MSEEVAKEVEKYQKQFKIEKHVSSILTLLGEDVTREGLVETPKRVAKSYNELFAGYNQEDLVIKTFHCKDYDEMILLKNIEFSSTCEHHMLPFIGKAHIAYIPGESGRVIGVSKLARILDLYAKRLQIQEQLTVQIGKYLVNVLAPTGVAVIIEAQHMCMKIRGVKKHDATMVTSYMYGAFRENASTRKELLDLIRL